MPSANSIGVRVPVIDDAPDLPIIVGNAVSDLTPQVVPRFGSTGARDAAFGAGQFRVCTVGDVLWMRRGSTWVTMLAASDIDTGWLAPSMASGWSALVADPIRYRITAGMVFFRGSAYRSDGVPTPSAMASVPSNALPGNASGFGNFTLTVPAIGTTITTTATMALCALSLRADGTIVCTVPGGAVAGVTKVGAQTLQWALS